jgi:lysophospholipase L1-like esterase
MNLTSLAGLLALVCAALASAQSPEAEAEALLNPVQSKTFPFKDGDRLVLLGSTVLEREHDYGSFEPRLDLALGEEKVTVRNLAWSGDTVFGHARSYFGPPEEGLQRLSGHLEMIKPTVVLLCYGSELAFERLGGLPEFLTGYRNLIELIRAKCPGVRIIIATPPPLETLPPPLPDLGAANRNLSSLRDALHKFSVMQNAFFIDWFELMGGLPKPGIIRKPLTENGVHYTRAGYEVLSAKLIEGLGLKLPDAPAPALESLRRAVIAKDTLFFNRWRPHNETYLFGFRKHEQGQNAKEIPMFDPLITQADETIQKLKEEALAQARRP